MTIYRPINIVTMDFCQLLREERRRAREATQTTSPTIIEAKLDDKLTKDKQEMASLGQNAFLKVWTKR